MLSKLLTKKRLLDGNAVSKTVFLLSFLCFLGAFMFVEPIIALCFSLLPMILIGMVSVLNNSKLAFGLLFVVNYFAMGITRYVPAVKGGILMEGFILLVFVSVILALVSGRLKLGKMSNPYILLSSLWVIYCIFEIFNPNATSILAWVVSVRGSALYMFLIAILVSMLLDRYSDIKKILYVWSVLTIIAVLKALMQRHWGFDAYEMNWLYSGGGSSTHLIRTGARYFSIYTDAANFGGGMGLSLVVFSIVSLYIPKRKVKIYFMMVALLSLYGLMVSGTRSALAVPFAGFTLYIILSKQFKIMLIGSVMLIGTVVFLNYTMIGHGNEYVRRMRSAFNVQDESFQVRLRNQALMREYMEDKPFGIGVGLGGVKAKQYANSSYMSQIPTDSWFVMIWVETGIVGLILHIAILLSIIGYGAYIVMFRIRSPQLRGVLSAMLSGSFGVCAMSYGNEILGQLPTGLIVYTMFGVIYISERIDPQMPDYEQNRLL